MALISQEVLKQAQAATVAANPSGNAGGTTVYSATAVTMGQSYDANIYDDFYGKTDEYTGYNRASDAAFDLQKHGDGLFDRTIMDSVCNVEHNLINNQDWRVDLIEEDANGDGVLDESDAKSVALLDAIVDSFDSELDLYIENRLQEVISAYGPGCNYNLKAIFGSPNSPATIELAKLGIRADAIGDHDAWQNRTYSFSLVNMEGTDGMSDEEILAHVYAEDAEILEDSNGKKGSIIFADCLTADGTAQGAETNISSILDQLGYECISKADFMGNRQGYEDLIANIQTGLDNNLYAGSGQTINNKYGRTLTMAQGVSAVFGGINGNAYGNKGWFCKALTFEHTLDAVNARGASLYQGGRAVRGAAVNFGITNSKPDFGSIETLSDKYAETIAIANDENVDLQTRMEAQKEAEEIQRQIAEKSMNLTEAEKQDIQQQIAVAGQANFNSAVKDAQAAVDEAIENGEDVDEVIETIASQYGVDADKLADEIDM
ncbi:MAG: hypothetical protein IJB79_02150 [Candidatus Gastranaerophilales bacterium]|nr:hypothetical protein [Candidatus Gastranaerophilales bacterium]